MAGLAGHLDSVLDPRSIGCWPPEPACRRQTTKTHFEEDVRFACDGDIAFVIWEFAGPKVFVASLSRNAFIDGDRALGRRQNRCGSTPGGFESVRGSPLEDHESHNRHRTFGPTGFATGTLR